MNASQGNRSAFDELFPLVYAELKRVARSKLRREAEGHTFNSTALVHEAYIKLVRQDRVEWQSRAHFFAVAAQAMRRILVNHAKARSRMKRGMGQHPLPLEEAGALASDLFTDEEATELIALDEALERLRAEDPRGVEVVEYRFFGGLSHADIAEVMGLSEVTVRRRWRFAKTWLRRTLGAEPKSLLASDTA